MRLAVMADIHGNLEAFEAVLADMADRGVDAAVSLGDNVGYGADSEAVIRMLRERDIPRWPATTNWPWETPAFAAGSTPSRAGPWK
jgi:hypothetical protein